MDSITKKIFSKNIKIARKELGLTSNEFSLRLGMSPGNTSGWELGKSYPSKIAFEKIVNILGIRKEFLETGEGEILSSDRLQSDK